MTSAISTFLESLAPASAGVGLLDSGSSEAEGKPATPPTPPTPPTPADSEMGATAGGRSASNATSAKRSKEPPRAPPADVQRQRVGPGPLPRTPPRPRAPRRPYIRTFRAVAVSGACRQRTRRTAVLAYCSTRYSTRVVRRVAPTHLLPTVLYFTSLYCTQIRDFIFQRAIQKKT